MNNKPIYKKWWFWVCLLFIWTIIHNTFNRPKIISKYKDKVSSLDLSDTARALSNLNIIYKDLELEKGQGELGNLRDSVKKIMISLGKDPDYVAPKIVTKESKLLKSLSSWDGSLPPFVEIIKNNMNDPESFDHVNTYYLQSKKDSSDFIITMVYRGKNAFGAKIKSKNSCVYNVDTKQIRDIE